MYRVLRICIITNLMILLNLNLSYAACSDAANTNNIYNSITRILPQSNASKLDSILIFELTDILQGQRLSPSELLENLKEKKTAGYIKTNTKQEMQSLEKDLINMGLELDIIDGNLAMFGGYSFFDVLKLTGDSRIQVFRGVQDFFPKEEGQ